MTEFGWSAGQSGGTGPVIVDFYVECGYEGVQVRRHKRSWTPSPRALKPFGKTRLGDPDSEPVKQRGRDEQFGEALSARASNALLLFRALMNVEGVEIRTHVTTLYKSVYLTEKKLLVNQHIYGLSAAQSPVVDISRDPSTNMADTYARSFELVWQKAAST